MRKQADFVVIGSGGAGMAAAVTAMQNGVKKVIVLEKEHFLGGNSRMAGGDLFTAYHEDRGNGLNVVDDTFRDTMAFHHYRMINPKVLRAFLEKSSGTVEFVRAVGVPYTDNGTIVDNKYPFGNFYHVIKALEKALLAGAENEILRDTAAKKILTDESGAVIGVEAENKAGEKITIDTKNVAITTGGFTGNSELLHKYFPEEYDDCFYTDALPLQGDGIGLAEGAGADLNPHCTLVKENAYSCDSRLDAPNRSAHNGRCIWVNTYGERFMDESSTMGNECANALTRQPGMIGYALFEQNILNDLEKRPMMMGGPGGPGGPGGMPQGGPEGEGPGGPGGGMPHGHGPRASMKESLENEYKRKEGWVEKADTLEELAGKIGIDYEALKATVDEYNGYCKAGRDGLFAKAADNLVELKEGPYYALKFRPILIETQGPIIINEKMQVLNKDHKVIPGLYAGGVCSSGSQGQDYHLRGSNLGYSVTSGRIIGMNVAASL